MLRQTADLAELLDGTETPLPGHILRRRPAGVVLGIAPWNAAVTLATRAVAAPLACGNTVVMKTSELCPRTHALIVEAGLAGSHAKRGWEVITDACVAAVAARSDPSVFILWGGHAQAKAGRIEHLRDPRHCVIESPHPSPLSARRGFFGSRPFSQANAFLERTGRGAIDWSL